MTRTNKAGSQQWTAVSPFLGLVTEHCVAKICSAAQEPTRINCKMTRSLYQVPYFKLTRVDTSRVSGRKKTKCHDWCLEKQKTNVTGQGQTKHISLPFPPSSSTRDPVVELFVRFAAYIFYPSAWRKFYTSEVCVLLVSYTARAPFSVLCYAYLITSGKQTAILRSALRTAIYSSITLTD